MKELSREKQLEINGGSVIATFTACILATVALYRILKIQRMNIMRLVGQRRY